MNEHIPCNLCGNMSVDVLFQHAPSGRIVRCTTCGLVYASPRRPERLIDSRHDSSAHAEKEVSASYYTTEIATRELNDTRRLLLLEQYAERRGKLLDVGAYIGVFLKIAQEREWDVLGIEPVAVAAEYGEKHFHVPIRVGTLEDLALPPSSFDAITLYETIEHLPDPMKTIKKLHRLLKRGGVLAIETPTIRSLPFWILRRRWRQFLDSHFYFFTPQTLSRALSQTGFEILDVRLMSKRISLSLLATQIGDRYSKRLGAFVLAIARLLHIEKKNIVLNPLDVMMIHARKKG